MRLRTIVEFSLKVNEKPTSITDQDMADLRAAGRTDKRIVQLCHWSATSYNRPNLAHQTDDDYRDACRHVAFDALQQA
jgi:hypothetical protein